MSAFEQYLGHPSVNQRKDVQVLLRYWKESDRGFSKEGGFKAVYPGGKFKLQKWHLLTSRLFKLAEQFMVSNELKKDEMLQKELLVRAYRNKGIISHFESTIRNTQKLLDQAPIRNTSWLHSKFITEFEHYDFIASHNRKERTNLQEVNDFLDAYYMSHKLRTACLSISRKTINAEDYNIHFIHEIIERVKTKPQFLDIPSIAVYYYFFQAVTASDNEHWFIKLRSAISTYSSHFVPSEKRDIVLLTINYCIRKLNTGAAYFAREAFELYRLSIDDGYLLEGKFITESAFSNIISLATKLKEFVWAENFVETHRIYLNKNVKDPVYHYNKSLLHYEQGRLEQSMVELAQVDTKITFILLATKSLQIKIYYELEEFEALENLLESFRVFLQRRKDLGYRKESFENLVHFTRRLMTIFYKEDKEKQALIEAVKSAKVFAGKDWVLQKLK